MGNAALLHVLCYCERVRINYAVATPASVWTMHRPYWPHQPYTVFVGHIVHQGRGH